MKKRIAASAVLGTLFLGLGTPAFAQTATTTTTATTASTAKTDRSADHAARRDANAADLASRLGITKEKVLAALTAREALPHVKPTDGTRPTAAERKAAASARLASLAGSLGVSVDALTKALVEQQKAHIDARVTNGSLTAAQAAARKAVVDADVAAGDFGGERGHDGLGGGHGGGRGRR